MRLGSSEIKYKSTQKPLSWDLVRLHIDEVRLSLPLVRAHREHHDGIVVVCIHQVIRSVAQASILISLAPALFSKSFSISTMDAAGLFGQRDRSRSRSRGRDGVAKERRDKLYPNDTVAAQFLNPYGENGFSKVPDAKLWAAVAKGSKTVQFHSELAADEGNVWRNSVGISRAAEAVAAAIVKLKDPNTKQLIKEVHYNKAMAEADVLLPHLNVLNSGKGSESGEHMGSLRSLRSARSQAAQPGTSEEQVRLAAKAFRKWLLEANSALRGMLMVISGDGAFWSGYAATRTARACIQHKPMSEEKMCNYAARRAGAGAVEGAAPSDATGLFGR